MFIFAERTGDWEGHIEATRRMLNLFAATGHYHYAKSGRMYLQQMLDLHSKHPSVYKYFLENGYHTIRRSNRYCAGLWSDLVIEQVMMKSLKSRGGLTQGRGMTESVRHQWVHTNHACAVIHDAMTKITNLSLVSSEQHVEMGKSRKHRDFNDLLIFYEWLSTHSPFDLTDDKLRSISSGITVSKENTVINCDCAEDIGAVNQKSLDGSPSNGAKLKSKSRIQCIDDLYNNVAIKDGKYIKLKPEALFIRLTLIAQRESDLEKFFDYELTTSPMSLFKDGMMRKPNKAVLRNELLASQCNVKEGSKHVLDGGALLHIVRWQKEETFQSICQQYVKYVRTKFGQSTVVFDGYGTGPTTKDHEHLRRSLKKKGAVEFTFNNDTKARIKQESFLSNEKNKAKFVTMLSHFLRQDGQIVWNSKADADTEIVKCAIEKAGEYCINVHADDTDVTLVLMYHWNPTLKDITFTSEISKKSWSIKDAVGAMKDGLQSYIMVLHAFTGCDTTSAIHTKGKISLMKKILTSTTVWAVMEVIKDPWANPEEVGTAGQKLFVLLYGGTEKDNLTAMRYVFIIYFENLFAR